jgi:hypothetical protein
MDKGTLLTIPDYRATFIVLHLGKAVLKGKPL